MFIISKKKICDNKYFVMFIITNKQQICDDKYFCDVYYHKETTNM